MFAIRHLYRLPLAALAVMTVIAAVGLFFSYRAFAEEGSPPVSLPVSPEVERINREIQGKRSQIESLRAEIGKREEQVRVKRTEAASLKNQIGILENRIAKAALDIQAAEIEIETTHLEIAGLESVIAERIAAILKNKAFVAEYLRTIYRYDDRGYLEVLLLHDKFSEFFDVIKSLQDVQTSLTDRVQALKADKAALEEQKKTREEKRIALQNLKKRIEQTRENLEDEQQGKQTLVHKVQLSEKDLRRELATLRAEQQAIDNELAALENSLRKKLSENARFNRLGASVGKFSWPVSPERGITTYFHDPDYPFRYVFEHPGLDIRSAQGNTVRAASGGVVARAKDAGLGYSYIMIVHPGGLSTVYGHVSKLLVTEDQFVEAGDVVALSGGAPGTAGAGKLTTGPHLHFEIRLNGIPVNPLEYLQ